MNCSSWLLRVFFICVISIEAYALEPLTVASEAFVGSNTVTLGDQWWFHFGEHLIPSNIPQEIASGQMQVQNVPAPWKTYANVKASSELGHGVGTYARRIVFSADLQETLWLKIPLILDHYQIWWLPDGGDSEAALLATSLNWGKPGTVTRDNQTFPLPADLQSGWMIIHVSKQLFYNGGMLNAPEITSIDPTGYQGSIGLIIRAMMVGSLLIMFVHYIVQFLYWRDNYSAFFIAVLCLTIAIRTLGTSGITDIILSQLTEYHGVIRLRVEYFTMVLGPVLFISLFCVLMPLRFSQRLMQVSWALALIAFGFSFTSFTQMTRWLPAYQAIALLSAFASIAYLVVASVHKKQYSFSILASTTIVFIAVIVDILASNAGKHHVTTLEFSMFVFVVFQAQIVGKTLQESLKKSILLKQQNRYLKVQHQEAIREGQRDHLTGLFNRKALDEKLRDIWQSGYESQSPVGIIIMDIDYFKRVNDEYGHLVGDKVLVHCAKLLQENPLRHQDLIARYGGEEFMVVLSEADLAGTIAVAEKIRKQVEGHPFVETDMSLSLTISLGVHSEAPLTLEVQDAIKKADQALYVAKGNGRNQVQAWSQH